VFSCLLSSASWRWRHYKTSKLRKIWSSATRRNISEKSEHQQLTYILTHSMEQSPSRAANSSSSSQLIPRILCNLKVHYRSHKCPPPVPIPPHSTSYRSILILSSHLRLGLPSGLFPSGFPTKTLYTPLFSPIRATCPVHQILLDFITSATAFPKSRGALLLVKRTN